MVLRAGRTKRRQIADALCLIDEQKLLGVVLNGARVMPEKPYSHYHQPAAGLPGPKESDDDPNWEPRGLTRSLPVTTGIVVLATLLFVGSFGRWRQAASDTPVAAPQEVSIDSGSREADDEADIGIPIVESAGLFEISTQVRVNLRTAPSTEAHRLLTLEVGVKLLALEVRSEWIRVRASGAEGWVHRSGLLESPEGREPRLLTVKQDRQKARYER